MREKPQKVTLFHTCLVNDIYPDVGMSVVEILEHLGLDVDVPPHQTCCGQPAFNSGFRREAAKIARYTIEMLADTRGPIIIPSGSCTDMIKHHYPLLFRADDSFLAVVVSVTERCYEFTQFLVDILEKPDLGAHLKAKVAYHPSCHLLRGLGIRRQPLVLLENIRNLEIVEFAEQDECCGFGGTFSTKEPDISGTLMNRKIQHIESSRAEMIVSCDAGCLMHLEGGLHRRGSALAVHHIAQVIHAGLA